MFTSVEFERRNGQPVFIQPRHVAALEPIIWERGEQSLTQTIVTLASGKEFTLVEPPSVVRKKLQAGN